MNEQKILDKSKDLDEKQIAEVLRSKDKIYEKLKEGKLERFFESIGIFISLIRDYINGSYKAIPFWVISSVSFSLIYLLNPLDVVPDFLVGLGFIDDAAVIATCIKMISKELDKYTEFKNTHK